MNRKFYVLTLLVIVSTLYGTYSAYKMVIHNRTPYTIECVGKKLNPNQVIAFSNFNKKNLDTIYMGFEQSKEIMPSTLAYLYFDKNIKQYVVKNSTCIFNPDKGIPKNYFLPFCHTLNDGLFQKGKYFGNDKVIYENILVERGIKYNSAVGDRENRISVQLQKYNGSTYLQYKDDGIKVKYMVQSNKQNTYDVFINKPVLSNNQFIFSFTNTCTDTGQYNITISATTLTQKCAVKDAAGKLINTFSGSLSKFDVGGFLFEVTPKYTIGFVIVHCLFFIILLYFQCYFLFKSTKSVSPPIFSLFSIRILLNCIVFLATPVFVTAYYLGDSRIWYLALIVLLNASYFTSKTILHNLNIHSNSKLFGYSLFVVIAILTVFVWKFTWNESLFGRIPILHIQKVIILILIFALQHSFFSKVKFGNLYKFIILVLYSLGLSILTKDLGSFIYATLAFVLIELIRKTLKLKYFLLCVFGLVSLVYTVYINNPTLLCGDKTYRIIAPFTTPENLSVITANEADKETYSTLIFNLKNIFSLNEPHFNEVVVPGSMRSTLHSDFAFHWAFSFGGFVFLMIFLPALLLLVNELLLLLFLSIREVKITSSKYFALPQTKESELIRFFLAMTIIQFVLPLLNNILLVPLTGQSLPALSISNVEIFFLIVLLLCISSVFTNEKYITEKGTSKYLYGDAKNSIKFVINFFIIALVAGFAYKAVSLKYTDNSMQWTKHVNDEDVAVKKNVPNANDKDALIAFAKNIIGDDNLTMVSSAKKNILKELASLYFAGKPYSQTVFESKTFANNTAKLLNQMTVDSLFNEKSKLLSGTFHPFGNVYCFSQKVNNKPINSVSNPYYSSIPPDAQTINADLTALCSKALEAHLQSIGVASNIGSVVIVEHNSGNVITNATFPLNAEINSNEIHYLCGSLKKILIAYCALQINPAVKEQVYNNKSFKKFIENSDDDYAANLLRTSLMTNKDKLNNILKNDFELPLFSNVDDSYLDVMPTDNDYDKPLDRNNTIYRQSIGQQRPYKFIDIIKWYSRLASGKKIELKYTLDEKKYEILSMNDADRIYLKECFNSVLFGTASKVKEPLLKNGIDIKKMFCKTGTAERSDRKGNSSSSFIICNDKYTIGIMLKGDIPNNKENYSAKDLFITFIPILKKYNII